MQLYDVVILAAKLCKRPIPEWYQAAAAEDKLAYATKLRDEIATSRVGRDVIFRSAHSQFFPKKVEHPVWHPLYGKKSDAIHVAFLTPSLLIGGAERWVASLCTHFDRRIVQPTMVICSEHGHKTRTVERWVPRDTMIRCATPEEMPEACKSADVLISWGHPNLPDFTKDIGIPIVDVQHGTMGFDMVQRMMTLGGINAGAHLVCVGEACLDNYPDEATRAAATIIDNGAETDRSCARYGRDATRKQMNIPADAKVVAYVGRFAEVKNIEAIIAAMAELPPEWFFVAAGPQYRMPAGLVELGDRVRILGPVDSPGDILAAADVACAPSHHEANSIAVMEFMLSGCPIVTTAYPAALSLLAKHGPTSYIIPLQPSGKTLADAIIGAELIGRGGDTPLNASRVAWEHYTAPAMAARWEKYLVEKFRA